MFKVMNSPGSQNVWVCDIVLYVVLWIAIKFNRIIDEVFQLRFQKGIKPKYGTCDVEFDVISLIKEIDGISNFL